MYMLFQVKSQGILYVKWLLLQSFYMYMLLQSEFIYLKPKILQGKKSSIKDKLLARIRGFQTV